MRAQLDPDAAYRHSEVVHHSDKAPPTGQVALPAAAIGALSLLLAVGLDLLGVTVRMDEMIRHLVARDGRETFAKSLPEWVIWSGTTIVAFGVAFTILQTPGMAKRWIFWLSAIISVVAWAPVLSLASHAPDVSTPCIAALWSGICAIVYTARHRMPIDQ